MQWRELVWGLGRGRVPSCAYAPWDGALSYMWNKLVGGLYFLCWRDPVPGGRFAVVGASFGRMVRW
jgi:hypothetical protein